MDHVEDDVAMFILIWSDDLSPSRWFGSMMPRDVDIWTNRIRIGQELRGIIQKLPGFHHTRDRQKENIRDEDSCASSNISTMIRRRRGGGNAGGSVFLSFTQLQLVMHVCLSPVHHLFCHSLLSFSLQPSQPFPSSSFHSSYPISCSDSLSKIETFSSSFFLLTKIPFEWVFVLLKLGSNVVQIVTWKHVCIIHEY